MTGAPVKCSTCGHMWRSQGIMIGGATGTLSGCKEGPCRRCGGMGDVMDGTYLFNEHGTPTAVLAGSPETHAAFSKLFGVLRDKSVQPEQLNALAEVVRQRRAGKISEDEAALAAAGIKPEFGEVWRGQQAGWLALILMILFFMIQEFSSDRDHAEVMAAIERQHAQDLRQYEIEQDQLVELRKLALAMTARPSAPITAPPPGPRSKRQQRRDRRFQKQGAEPGPTGGGNAKGAPQPK